MEEKSILFVLVFCFLFCILDAQTPEWVWANHGGSSSSDMGVSIIVDSNNYSYVTGEFRDVATFGSTVLTSAGEDDIYIAKMDTNGNWIWAKRAGGSNQDFGSSIILDNLGNVYVTGDHDNNADFGSTILGGNGIYVTKLDNNGNWLWTEHADASQSTGIDVDALGNAYITGIISWNGDFGDYHLDSNGQDDIFVAKISSNGTWLRVENAGGTESDYAFDIDVDTGGNAYITGYFKDSASFGVYNLISYGHRDIFVCKINSTGVWSMATNAGGVSWDSGQDIYLDNTGNIYCTGFFYSEATFGTSNITGYGSNDIFVSKLDNSGNWLWTNYAGGLYVDTGWGIKVDSNMNTWITGDYMYGATFGTTNLSSYGVVDLFVAQLDGSGNWNWAINAGSNWYEYSYDLDLDNSDNGYITGKFQNTITFQDTMSSYGSYDVFVAKITDSMQPSPPANVVMNVSGATLTISWNAVPAATSYKVFSSNDPYTGFAEDTTGTFNGTSWSVTLSGSKKYFYVKAIN